MRSIVYKFCISILFLNVGILFSSNKAQEFMEAAQQAELLLQFDTALNDALLSKSIEASQIPLKNAAQIAESMRGKIDQAYFSHLLDRLENTKKMIPKLIQKRAARAAERGARTPTPTPQSPSKQETDLKEIIAIEMQLAEHFDTLMELMEIDPSFQAGIQWQQQAMDTFKALNQQEQEEHIKKIESELQKIEPLQEQLKNKVGSDAKRYRSMFALVEMFHEYANMYKKLTHSLLMQPSEPKVPIHERPLPPSQKGEEQPLSSLPKKERSVSQVPAVSSSQGATVKPGIITSQELIERKEKLKKPAAQAEMQEQMHVKYTAEKQEEYRTKSEQELELLYNKLNQESIRLGLTSRSPEQEKRFQQINDELAIIKEELSKKQQKSEEVWEE